MSHHKQPNQHQTQSTTSAAQAAPAAKGGAAGPKGAAPGGEASGGRPSVDRIRARAYELSQARNGGPGSEAGDWSQAEKELTASAAAKA